MKHTKFKSSGGEGIMIEADGQDDVDMTKVREHFEAQKDNLGGFMPRCAAEGFKPKGGLYLEVCSVETPKVDEDGTRNTRILGSVFLEPSLAHPKDLRDALGSLMQEAAQAVNAIDKTKNWTPESLCMDVLLSLAMESIDDVGSKAQFVAKVSELHKNLGMVLKMAMGPVMVDPESETRH